jgi:hypothetical protein
LRNLKFNISKLNPLILAVRMEDKEVAWAWQLIASRHRVGGG